MTPSPIGEAVSERRFARLSQCGVYRYELSRIWDETKPRVCWVMLNPSTADGEQDDPTIRRCRGFTTAWGYGGFDVVNLFALRATNPMALGEVDDPIGPDNDWTIKCVASVATLVVAAWGPRGKYLGRDRYVAGALTEGGSTLHCIGTTKRGYPRHPLMMPKSARPTPFLGNFSPEMC